MKCPLDQTSSVHIQNEAIWHKDNSCSYCGSMHPDDFMKHSEERTAVVGPTDKNYKAYVKMSNGDTRKFYFEHLSEDQKKRFVELLNNSGVDIGYPGYFYVYPYFIGIVK